MAITVNTTDTFEQWRVKTNQLGSDVDSNIAAVRADLSSNVTTLNTSIVGNVNNILANINSTSGNIVTGNIVVSGNISAGNIRITNGIVTANLTVTANANIASNISILGNAVVRNNLFVTSGNIGLGTSAPTAKLDIMAGSLEEVASFDSTGNAYISLNQNGINTAVIRSDNFTGSGSSIVIDNNTFNTHATANAFVFRTLNAGGGLLINRVTITQAGRLGVGLGIPSSTFHVFGNSIVSSNLLVEGNVFVPSGNIGIGTSSPAAKLHISGDMMKVSSVADPGNFTLQTAGAGGAIRFRRNSSAIDRYLSFGRVDNNDAYSEAVRIVESGNVGIGINAPNYDLHLHRATASTTLGLSTSAQKFSIQLTNSTGGSPPAPSLVSLTTDADRFIVDKPLFVSGSFSADDYAFTSVNSIGSVIVALYVPGTHPGTNSRPLSIGDTIAGSTLRYNFTPNGGNGNDFDGNRTRTSSTTYDGGGSTLSGTWRCMGRPSYAFTTDGVDNFYTWHTGLFVRVS